MDPDADETDIQNLLDMDFDAISREDGGLGWCAEQCEAGSKLYTREHGISHAGGQVQSIDVCEGAAVVEDGMNVDTSADSRDVARLLDEEQVLSPPSKNYCHKVPCLIARPLILLFYPVHMFTCKPVRCYSSMPTRQPTYAYWTGVAGARESTIVLRVRSLGRGF